MTPQYLTMAGLVLDIAGGFLVAVEAIKIENLRILRDKVLNRTNSYILGPRIAPQYVMDDADVKSNIKNSQKNELNEPLPAMGCLPLLTLHVVVGFTPLLLIDKFTNSIVSTTCLTEISRLSWSLKILFISIAVIIGVPLMGAIGSVMFSTFSITLKSLMKTIDFIEAETPTGTVGIIGFFLLTSGFILQFIATFLTL